MLCFQEADAELGNARPAGLASQETLDDTTEKAPVNEDGMETVRLDGDANDIVESPKQPLLQQFVSAARKNLFVSSKHTSVFEYIWRVVV